MPALDLRLRVTSPELLSLPWSEPLEEWDPTTVALQDIPVGPSRHLVRFVEADQRLWALKSLPRRVADKEYDVLREMEDRSLMAVRAAGVVVRRGEDAAVLVTHFLERSWQYRRLLMRVPASMQVHRGRLFDAMALLMVDLHRNGIYWGDCSLANTLFTRDGQSIQAWMVDAETAAFHPALSDGQRREDLDIMVENVAGGLLDVAARREEPPGTIAGILDEATGIADRYDGFWQLLHDEPIIGLDQQDRIQERMQRLNDSGFTLDEVRLEPTDDGSAQDEPARPQKLRMKVAVAARTFHAQQLRALTGLEAGEGQASILLKDLQAYRRRMQEDAGRAVPEGVAARHWLVERFTPASERAHLAVGGRGDPIQAYCDLLEVRWLLSEDVGRDVGDEPALQALSQRVTPDDSAATLAFVDVATAELPAVAAELVDDDSEPSDGER